MLYSAGLQVGYPAEEVEYTCGDDQGIDSDNDSELEEIEQDLYSQIYFEKNSSSVFECKTPQLFSSPGPGGDNFRSSIALPSVDDLSDSVCLVKTLPTGRTSQHLTSGSSTRKRGVKRKHVETEAGTGLDVDSFVMGNLSTGSELESTGETSFALDDLHVHVHHGDTPSESEQNWAIIDADRHPGGRKAGSRYYKNMDVRCLNCNERGHLSRSCPRPQKHLTCYLCGCVGHNMRSCPNPVCYNCDSVAGHRAKSCPHPRRRRFERCRRCFMVGHVQAMCPDLWRQYHLTTREGKLVQGRKEEGNPRVFCHNCGEDGHFGYECQDDRMDRYSLPVYPFIARYRKFQQQTVASKTSADNDCDNSLLPERPNKKRKLEKTIPEGWKRSADGGTTAWRRRTNRAKRRANRIPRQEKAENNFTEEKVSKVSKGKKKSKKKKLNIGVIAEAVDVLMTSVPQKKPKKRKQKDVGITQSVAVSPSVSTPQQKNKKNKKKQSKAERQFYTQLYREAKRQKVKGNSETLKLQKCSRGVKQKHSVVQVQVNRGFKITLPDLHISQDR